MYNVSLLCVFHMLIFKYSRRRNFFPHLSHWKRFSFLWIIIWYFNRSLELNKFPRSMNLKDCSNMWRSKYWEELNAFQTYMTLARFYKFLPVALFDYTLFRIYHIRNVSPFWCHVTVYIYWNLILLWPISRNSSSSLVFILSCSIWEYFNLIWYSSILFESLFRVLGWTYVDWFAICVSLFMNSCCRWGLLWLDPLYVNSFEFSTLRTFYLVS